MTILCIDGYNFLHRARSGFQLGEYHVCYNFFRNLRSLVDQFKPNRIYFVTEGRPVKRLENFPEYKANRHINADKADLKELAKLHSFYRQKELIIDLLKTCFPISVMRHPDHEGDDVIYNLVKTSSTAVEWVVVSNDTDFIQLLNEFPHVKLYNPMTKEFVEKPSYDYVSFKALKGDTSDNIPGVPGFGPVKAEALIKDERAFHEFTQADTPEAEQWANNFDLIHFFEFSDYELNQVESSSPVRDWAPLRKAFEDWKFQSLLKEKTWDKFLETFNTLWG